MLALQADLDPRNTGFLVTRQFDHFVVLNCRTPISDIAWHAAPAQDPQPEPEHAPPLVHEDYRSRCNKDLHIPGYRSFEEKEYPVTCGGYIEVFCCPNNNHFAFRKTFDSGKDGQPTSFSAALRSSTLSYLICQYRIPAHLAVLTVRDTNKAQRSKTLCCAARHDPLLYPR